MFKSTEPCRGEGCNSYYIQNKKYHLCSKCVFKKNHQGKEQGEVYSERSKQREFVATGDIKIKGIKPNYNFLNEDDIDKLHVAMKDCGIIIVQGDVEFHNMKAQDNIQEHDDEEERKFFEKENKKPKKNQKSIKKLSPKQAEIERKYKLVCIDMDYIEEKVCSGCLRYQGGDIKLSHSHIISRKECKEIGKPELIYDRRNITYHCMTFSNNKGCHLVWENPKRRHELKDYEKNLSIIHLIAPELFNKYKK